MIKYWLPKRSLASVFLNFLKYILRAKKVRFYYLFSCFLLENLSQLVRRLYACSRRRPFNVGG